MTRRLTRVALAVLLIASSSAPVFAALSAGQKMAAEVWIKQFAAAEFDVRQKAVDNLIGLGPDVVPVIQKALAETLDNEVKLRCQMVLKGIKEKYPETVIPEVKPAPAAPAAPDAPANQPRGPRRGPAPVVAPKDPGKFGFDASKVTVNVKDAELDGVLASLAEQSGNARVALPKDWEGKGVTLNAAGATYWEALDKLCASLGLTYTYVFDPQAQTREFRLQPLDKTVDVSAYAGPVVVKLDTATLTKRFRPGGGGFGMMRDGLTLTFAFYTEDRLQPLESDAEITKIVAGDGKEIALDADPAAAAGGGRAGRRQQQRGFGRQARGPAGMIVANASTPPPGLDKLASVEGVVHLTFGTGTKELKVVDALNGGNKSVTVGNAKLTVTRVQRMGGGRGGNNGGGRGGNNGGAMLLTVKYEVDGKEETLPEFGRDATYGFALIDPNGEKHTGFAGNFGGFGGRGGFGGPGQGPGNPPAPGNDPNNPAAGAPNATTLFFNNAPELDGAWTLVLTAPDQLTEKEFPFKFTDISVR